jgi:hypothetical protein
VTPSADGHWFEEDADSISNPSVTELSLSLGTGETPAELSKGLNDLQGYSKLTRLELWAPRFESGDLPRMVAQTLAETVIHMSLLVHLSIPEVLATEYFLLHISLLPRLETLIISPTPLTHSLLGGECYGFPSLRSLDVPNESFLRRFLSYPVRDLDALRVRNLDRHALPLIARELSSLRRLSIFIKGSNFTPQEVFVLGACFRLEEIGIITQSPLGMNDSDLHRFRAMFRNLRSLSIAREDSPRTTGFHRTDHRRDDTNASRVVEENGVNHGI